MPLGESSDHEKSSFASWRFKRSLIAAFQPPSLLQKDHVG
jgi:hypothetical protein